MDRSSNQQCSTLQCPFWAFDMAKTFDSYYYKTKGKWWDLYSGKDCVIWDDYRGSDYKYNKLLLLYLSRKMTFSKHEINL